MAHTTTWEPTRGDDEARLPEQAFAYPKRREIPLTDAVAVRAAIERFWTIPEVSDDERCEAFRNIKRAAEEFHVEIDGESYEEMCGKPQVEVLPRD